MVCMKDVNSSAKTHYLPPGLSCKRLVQTGNRMLYLTAAANRIKKAISSLFLPEVSSCYKRFVLPLSAKCLLSRGSSECWGFLCITIKSALEVTCCDLMLYGENGIEFIWILHIFTVSWRIVWELASSMQTSGDELFQRCLRAESKMGGAVMVT